jgi:hypothetical protein
MLRVNCIMQEGIEKNYRLKPYWGNPDIRNFRGGDGNRVMASRIEEMFSKEGIIEPPKT